MLLAHENLLYGATKYSEIPRIRLASAAPIVPKINCSEKCSDRVSSCIHAAPIGHSTVYALNPDL
jgi:hypothetical protein